jgi:amino acid adenylation domain-containing protein
MMPQFESYPLSPLQQWLWRRQQADGELAYRIQGLVDVRGELETETFERALTDVVQRHEILRTAFRQPVGLPPVQVVLESPPLAFHKTDLRQCNAAEQNEGIEGLWEVEASHKFNLDRGDVLRSHLVLTGEHSNKLIIAFPALCGDVHALHYILSEIGNAYVGSETSRNGSSEPLQYADVAQWQLDLLESTDASEGVEHWRRQVADDSFRISLPSERSSGRSSLFKPELLTLREDAVLSQQIQSVATDHYGVSLDLFLLSCWQVLLLRLRGELENNCVGVAVKGRNYEELTGSVGLFAKHLPADLRLRPGDTMSDVIGQMKNWAAEAEKWQDYFFWEKLDHAAEQPFFPFGFEYHEGCQTVHNGGLRCSVERRSACIDRFKIRLGCAMDSGTLVTEWQYDTQLYARSEVTHLAKRLNRLLKSLLENPDAPVTELPVVPDDEYRKTIFDWNITEAQYPRELCLHHLLELQVQRTPDAVAVVCRDEQLTYAEWNRRANRLTRYMVELGVGPEVVGILMDRSAEMMTALLAVLKTGAAYLPLDPQYPTERIHFMLKDARVAVLLTERKSLSLAPLTGIHVFCFERDFAAEVSSRNSSNLGLRCDPENLAYVIYTSGSTGQPKGVMIPHRGLVNYLSWCGNAYGVANGSGAAVHSSLGFDLTITTLFAPLLAGKAVHLLPEDRPLQALADFLRPGESGLSLLKVTPSHLEALARLLPEDGSRTAVNSVVIGGEALRMEIAAHWRQRGIARKLVNEYGPTETVVGCVVHEINCESGPVLEDTDFVPIGRPIANTKVYVLDEWLRPVCNGTPGELWIAGDGLARGYLNSPDVTAERFRPLPHTNGRGQRMYRSGDRARYQDDGVLEYLGRKDNQVKIRGYRIELGEVEACLREHAGIADALVVVREDVPNEKQIVAYVVKRPDQATTASMLVEYLRARLPAYMTPSQMLFLDELPLNANGKVDRRALPGPAPPTENELAAVGESRSLVEEIVAGVWRQILGRNHVESSANFFEIGGHSLHAIQLLSRLRELFHVDLSLEVIFEHLTLKDMANQIESSLAGAERCGIEAITAVPRDGPLPLSFAQQRLWFLEQLTPQAATYNISAPVSLLGSLNLPALEAAFSEVVRRHEVLRTRFLVSEGEPIQVTDGASVLSLPLVDAKSIRSDYRSNLSTRLSSETGGRGFDLERCPLLRIHVLQLSSEEQILLLVVHHIVCDGWSMGLLMQEVEGLYDSYRRGEPSRLAELDIQYRDYAVWQRAGFRGEQLESQLTYWRKQLSGAPMVLDLVSDKRRPATDRHHGRTVDFAVEADIVKALRRVCNRNGATLFMSLLAAFATVLFRYTRLTDMVIGVPLAGRTRPETDALIGFFVNTLPLRVDLSKDPSFEELLQRVREATIGAYTHQDVPFERLVEELQPERDLSRQQLFQVMLVLQNVPVPTHKSTGLCFQPVDEQRTTSKFDLTLWMADCGETLNGCVEYNSDLFKTETILRMQQHVVNLLRAAAHDPEERIQALPMIGEAERHTLITDFNDNKRDYEEAGTIVQLFETQERRTPDAIALVAGTQQLSYRVLNRRANQLAHYLLAKGVEPESRVAIWLDRSLEMILAILGVWKAGGAFVPLDPTYPAERLAFMTGDADPSAVILHYEIAEWLGKATCQCIRLGAPETIAELQKHRASNPSEVGRRGTPQPEHAAYVIYTSGSTGIPKGVVVTHGGVPNLARAQNEQFAVKARSRVLQLASWSFDVAVAELVMALTSGATLVLAPPGTLAGMDLESVLSASEITHATIPPSTLTSLGTIALPSLETLIVAGEACSEELVQRWSPGRRMINAYGPTEATVYVTASEPLAAADFVPIGKPIANTETYVLDEGFGLVPTGGIGELYTSGVGLARGYWGRPDLTAERFLPNSFADEPGKRLYRTGDLVRYRADGTIDFLGRVDNQVKIRGFRVELSEIEKTLKAHPAIREAVVLMQGSARDSQRLVAYVLPAASRAVHAGELRTYLKERLPRYMVPAGFVFLDHLPITSNGKLDRRALTSFEEVDSGVQTPFAPPRTTMEEAMACAWRKLLQVPRIGVHDNFFDLGGHSLLATRLVSEIDRSFQVKLPVQAIFEFPTISQLTTLVVSTRATEEDRTKVARMIDALKQLSPGQINDLLQAQAKSA